LSIADHSDHWQLQRNHRGEDLLQTFFRAFCGIFCVDYSSGQDISYQIDRLIACIWLDAINGEQNPFIFADLLFPSARAPPFILPSVMVREYCLHCPKTPAPGETNRTKENEGRNAAPSSDGAE